MIWNLYDDIQQTIEDEDRAFALSEDQWLQDSWIFLMKSAIKLSDDSDLLSDMRVFALIQDLKQADMYKSLKEATFLTELKISSSDVLECILNRSSFWKVSRIYSKITSTT